MLNDHGFEDEDPRPSVVGVILLALGYVAALAALGWFLVFGGGKR